MTSPVMANVIVAQASLVRTPTPVEATTAVQTLVSGGTQGQRNLKTRSERASSSNEKKIDTEASGTEDRVEGSERATAQQPVAAKKRKEPGKGDLVDMVV